MIFYPLALSLLLALPPLPRPPVPEEQSTQQLHQKLKEDLARVGRAIGETEQLIAQSAPEQYLPELRLRLCELYVEKSRYLYHLQGGSSSETKLLKQRVVQLYGDLLREHPTFQQNDKVRFYLAHEQRELGDLAAMVKTLEELGRTHPHSPLRAEAEQIMGDLEFDSGSLVKAEGHYREVLKVTTGGARGLALYKLAWVRVNETNHLEAVKFFEAAALSARGGEKNKNSALDLRRQALLDMVLSFTETRPAKGALAYFEKLSGTRATYIAVLEKLATRYDIKQQPENVVPVLRRLLSLQPEPARQLERVQRLYDGLVSTKEATPPAVVDIRAIVDAALWVKSDWSLTAAVRAQELKDLEEMARDLSTRLHLLAKKDPAQSLYGQAADAYATYFELFQSQKHEVAMRQNQADALYAAKRYPEAGMAYERVLEAVGAQSPLHSTALYGALLSHQAALAQATLDSLTLYQRVSSRSALKVLGPVYLARYGSSEEAPQVRFNVARAHYDDGDVKQASEGFLSFVEAHPTHKDAVVAAKLALDLLRKQQDFAALEELGRRLLATSLPASFLTEVRAALERGKDEALAAAALRSAESGGSLVEGLLSAADRHPGTTAGEKALLAAIEVSAEKKDFAQEQKLVERLLKDYPQSERVGPLTLLLAQRKAERGGMVAAAEAYEFAARLQPAAWASAAQLWRKGRRYDRATQALERAVEKASGEKKGQLLAEAAWVQADAGRHSSAMKLAEQALEAGGGMQAAAALLSSAEAAGPETLQDTASRVASSWSASDTSEASAQVAWLLAESRFQALQALPSGALDERIAHVQALEARYTQVASMGSAEWGVAALWRLALTYQTLAQALSRAAQDAGAHTQEGALLEQQVQALDAKATEAFNVCQERAQALGVFTSARSGCRERSAGSAAPAWQVPAREEAEPLLSGAGDAAALGNIGLGYLRKGRPGWAEWVLSRAVELSPRTARSHALLGTALAQQGLWSLAHASYQKALELNPEEPVAKNNLASLLCRFDLAPAPSLPPSSASPELDPTWRSCARSLSHR